MAAPAIVSIRARTRALSRFAWIVVAYFIFVVLLGAVVRATDSGGGCGASWPLCNGDFFPHHPRLATVIEFTHRSTSGVCTLLLLALASWTFAATPRGHRARRSVLWAFFFLIIEALLGAALVLRHWVEGNISTGRTVAQSIHFTNTLLLMAALALTAWFLAAPADVPIPSARSARLLTLTAAAATVLVGATGSLAALADTLFPSPSVTAALTADFAAASPLLVKMRWLHPAAALLALVCVTLLLTQRRHALGSGDRISLTVAALLGLQFVLGVADVLLLAPTWMQILHLLGADVYWVALVVLVGSVVWPVRTAT